MKAEKTPAEADALHTPSITEAQTFFSQVLRRNGAVFLTFADSKNSDAPPKQKHGQLNGAMWQWLQREQASGAGAFVTVNEVKPGASRNGKNITGIAAWFVDLDQEGLDLPAVLQHCPLPPTAAVQSSAGGKLHLYWRASEATLKQFSEIQRRLIAHFADYGADKAVKDLSRVMRLPGLLHLKGAPFLVRLVHLDGDREHTEAAMLDALADYAPKLKPGNNIKQFKRGLTLQAKADAAAADVNNMPYEYRLSATEAYMRACAAGAGPGNRNAPWLAVSVQCSANKIEPDDAERLLRDYCARVGWSSNAELRQAYSALNGAYGKTFESRLKAPRKQKGIDTGRYRELPTVSVKEAQEQLKGLLNELLDERKPGLNVIQVTTGTGKTWGTLEQLASMSQLDLWPDGLKIAYCVDSHKLGGEAAAELKSLGLAVPIYKGRDENNCQEYDVIAGMHRPSAYCKSQCAARRDCSYYKALHPLKKAPLVIMPKQAILNDSALLGAYDVLIVDEDLSGHLIRENSLSADDLRYARATAESEIALTAEEKQQCADYIAALGARLTGPGGLITDLPALPAGAAGLNDTCLIHDEGGTRQAPLFWQLVSEPGAVLRVSRGRLHITARYGRLIERLKEKCIINLDATPIIESLQGLEPVITRIDVTQSYTLMQDTRYRGTRKQLSGQASACRDHYLEQCRAILERRPDARAVVYTFKSQADTFRAALGDYGDRVTVTHYGNARGTNSFKGFDLLILAGLHIENLDAVRDKAAALGLDPEQTAAVLQALIDAEITQAVGRLRAVHRIKPAEVFVLSNEPLNLDKKPRPLDQWLSQHTKNVETLMDTVFPACLPDLASNIYRTENATTCRKTADSAGFKDFSPLERTRALVSECIAQWGFFAHGMIDAHRSEGTQAAQVTEIRPGCLEPMPLPAGLSARAFHANLGSALRTMAVKGQYLQIREHEKIKVWGDTARAAALLADPAELEAAKQAVRLAYDLNLTADLLADLKRLGLGHIDPVQEIRRLIDGDYLTDNWAVRYLHYLQDDRRFIAHRDVFTMAARGRWTADNLPVTTAEALTVTYERIAELGGGSAEPGAAEQTISYFRRRGLLQIRGADLVLTCEKTADELSQATGGPRKVKPVKHSKKAPWAPQKASGPHAGANTLTG